MSNKRVALGKAGEKAAADYLIAHGYQIIAKNFRCPYGELDLIAQDGGFLVFVEVKTRSSRIFGHPAESVTERKQRKISLVAETFIASYDMQFETLRFDVLAVDASSDGGFCITHIIDAFDGFVL